jgi:hypothetical protein
VVECMPCICEVLGSIPRTVKKKEKEANVNHLFYSYVRVNRRSRKVFLHGRLLLIYLFLVVLGFELRALCLLGKCSAI